MRIEYIHLAYGGHVSQIRAAVFGDWAAHENTNGDGFRVTHVPSGRNIAMLADEMDFADALAVAQMLGERASPLGPLGANEIAAIVAEALTSDPAVMHEDGAEATP